jgi:hypothetical protein
MDVSLEAGMETTGRRRAVQATLVSACLLAFASDVMLPATSVAAVSDLLFRPDGTLPDARLAAAEAAAMTLSQFALHLSIGFSAMGLMFRRIPVAAILAVPPLGAVVNMLPANSWAYETGLPTAFVIGALALTGMSSLRRTRTVGRVVAAGLAWISIGTLLLFHLVLIAGVGAQQRAGSVEVVRAMAAASVAGSAGAGCAEVGLACGTSGPDGVSGSLMALPEGVSGFVRQRAASAGPEEEWGFEKSHGTSFAYALRRTPDAVHYAVDAERSHAGALRTSILTSLLVAAANIFWAPVAALLVVMHQRAISRRAARVQGAGA